MRTMTALASGLAGAGALTLLHQALRGVTADAPRMDVLGMRAIALGMRRAGREPPGDDRLYGWSLAGDLLSNSLYYALAAAGSPEDTLARGALLGLAAGVGAVLLPGPLGLGRDASARSATTMALTVGLYLAGGLAAAAASRALDGEN